MAPHVMPIAFEMEELSRAMARATSVKPPAPHRSNGEPGVARGGSGKPFMSNRSSASAAVTAPVRALQGVCTPVVPPAKSTVPNGVRPVEEQQGNVVPFKVCRTETASSSSKVNSHQRISTHAVPGRNKNDHSEGPGVIGGRKASVVWFRNDLRLHDNEALVTANQQSTSVLPVYCFDPREFGKSPSGFDKTGPYRAKFLVESIADLQRRLRDLGSDLVVRMGKPEEVLAELVKKTGAGTVFCHGEVTYEEAQGEERVNEAVAAEGAKLRSLWGSTLYHLDDLPFELPDLPTNYGGFRAKMTGMKVRDALDAPAQLKGKPLGAPEDSGEIPTLARLGMDASAAACLDNQKLHAAAAVTGGESEGLRRLRDFMDQGRHRPGAAAATGANAAAAAACAGGAGSAYGAQFSCSISPWLAMGCLSPRRIYAELAASDPQAIAPVEPAAAEASAKGRTPKQTSGLSWLVFELLWRDFFRFITKKYATLPIKRLGGQPVAADAVVAAPPATAAPALAMA